MEGGTFCQSPPGTWESVTGVDRVGPIRRRESSPLSHLLSSSPLSHLLSSSSLTSWPSPLLRPPAYGWVKLVQCPASRSFLLKEIRQSLVILETSTTTHSSLYLSLHQLLNTPLESSSSKSRAHATRFRPPFRLALEQSSHQFASSSTSSDPAVNLSAVVDSIKSRQHHLAYAYPCSPPYFNRLTFLENFGSDNFLSSSACTFTS